MNDRNLDAVLREYSNPEPRRGIEQRVLWRVQGTPVRRPWWWAGWMLAATALVAVALLTNRPQAPIRLDARLPAASIPPSTNAAGSRMSTVRRRLPNVRKLSPPEPLTPEERALLRFVQSQPEQAREVLSQTAQIEPLTIEPLRIEKLQ